MFQVPRVSSLQLVPLLPSLQSFLKTPVPRNSLCVQLFFIQKDISRVKGKVPTSLNHPNSQNLRLSSMLGLTPRNHQPVYHKTDAVRSASLWFAAGDWRFGPSIEDGTVWAYATSDVLSGCDRPEFAVCLWRL